MKKIISKYCIFIVLGILLTGFILWRISYGYFIKTDKTDDIQNIATLKSLALSFESDNSSIALNNAIPLANNQAFRQKPYRFTLSNTSADLLDYYIVLSVHNSDNMINLDYVSVSLFNESINKVYHLSNLTEVETPQEVLINNNGDIYKSYIIHTGFFNGIAEKSFEYRMWINNDDYDAMSADIENKNLDVTISAVGAIKRNATFRDVLLGNNNMRVAPYPHSAPGYMQTFGETSLVAEPDDYGTSYYYRGNIDFNYVSFANKCWRIVRIVGDGSFKLVLYNYNPNGAANPCSKNEDGDTNAFARFNVDGTETIYSVFNNQSLNTSGIGLMYGEPNGSTYNDIHSNTNKSIVLTNLEIWYLSNLATYEDKLADTIWCNDKSSEVGTAIGIEFNNSFNFLYGTGKRFLPPDGGSVNPDAAPSLVCPNDNDGGSLSRYTVNDTVHGNGNLSYKIGMLTADEMAFAGSRPGAGIDEDYYLYKNASGASYWTLSPIFYTGIPTFFSVGSSTGILERTSSGYSTIAIRPAISLISSARVSGNGTSENPFILID